MGIKSLNKLLRDVCPEIFKDIHISEFAFKKIAIDISLYLCKFKVVCGDKWLGAFINLIASLRSNEIHCVMIYDSGAPPEKMIERAERAERKAKLEQTVFQLEDDLNQYYLSNEVSKELMNCYNTAMKKNKQSSRLLGTQKPKSFDIKMVEKEIERKRKQIINHSPEDFMITKKLFDILNVPYFDAPLEAETMCVDLCKRGIVDAVLTEDTDVLAYGTPIFLSKIDPFSSTCVLINLEEMLN